MNPSDRSTHPGSTSGNDAPRIDATRLRRSLLYMPGANERALEKAKGLDADGLIFDLEDGVSPDAKLDARERVCAAVRGGGYGHRELVVRCNGVDTELFAADVAAIAAAGPDALLVPKIESAADVRRVEEALVAGGAPDRTRIWVMLESPGAVLDAREIVSCSPRLETVVVGSNDLAKDLRVAHVPGRAPLATSLSLLVLAARATGKVILDSVFGDLDDPEGFAAECRQGRELGFDGKTLIHPRQLEACNRAFAPSGEDITWAERVIAAFETGLAAGRGVVSVDGQMIEALHVAQARELLARAEQIAATTG